MSEEHLSKDKFTEEDQKKFEKNGVRQYGVYSAIVFQMLATIGLSFWGGKKLNDYYEIESNLLTLGVGLSGFALALYSMLIQLKKIQENEK